MELCMRRCTSSCRKPPPASTAPARSSRSKRLSPRPPALATRELTVAGSCLSSPMHAKAAAPHRSGTSDVGSVACAASSRSTRWKKQPPRRPAFPDDMQVMTTTGERLAAFWQSVAITVGGGTSPVATASRRGCISQGSNSVRKKRCCRISSGFMCVPTRTDGSPKASNRWWMFRAAALDCVTTRTRHLRTLSTQRPIKAHAVWVLPVPGGPRTSVQRRSSAHSMARSWSGVRGTW
mmetsp:Transcript_91706/g.273643  ORF Transcript_91706/g.273643 Transcript_91706/m.273643 type:complete len:236 (-) Transcript_91706:463-1170(-)